MLSAQRLAPLAVALLLVLAGCGAGPSDGTATDTGESPDGAGSPQSAETPDGTATDTATGAETPDEPTPPDGTPTPGESANDTADGGETEYSIPVRNGTLPVDVNRTFGRTQTLMGTDVDPRPVEIRNLSEWRTGLPRTAANPFNAALGFENVSANWSEPSGLTQFTGYVYLHPGRGSPGVVERTLAHEFAHTIQYQANMLPWLDRLRSPLTETDQAKVYRALLEGGAVYVTDAYTHRYLDVQNNSAYVRERYEAGGPTYRSALGPYLFGKQYVAHAVDSPSNLSAVYENYPRTTEQLLHNYTRAEEPERNLSVTVDAGSAWNFRGDDTLGELLLRHAFGTELSEERAAAAAAGWGTDELQIFTSNGSDGRFGWISVHRWDNASEADEAFAALDEYETARAADSDFDFESVRIGEETTALVIGPDAFVDAASIDGTDADVTVEVGS